MSSSLLGHAQVATVAPLVTGDDLLAWAAASKAAHLALTADHVWRAQLCEHFRRVLRALLPPRLAAEEARRWRPEALAVGLGALDARQLYFDLKRVSSQPFGLTPRARLALEPPELHDWGRRIGELVLWRQALRAAEGLGLACAAERARRAIEPEALRLAVLQCPEKPNEAVRLIELCGVQCGAGVEEELRRLTGERRQKRAAWWRHLRVILSDSL